MRRASTATGLGVILFVVALLPLGILAAASVSIIEDQAARAEAQNRENAALDGAIRVAHYINEGERPDQALASANVTSREAYLLAPDGTRTGPDGPLPPDEELAARIGERVSGSFPGEDARIAWARIPGENLVLVTETPPVARGLLGPPLLIGGAVVLLTVGLGLLALAFARRWITQPLARLSDGSARIAAGEWDERVPEAGTAETARLARSFNRMAEEVEANERALADANRRLDEMLAARTEQLTRAVEDLRAFHFTVDHELREPLRSLETLAGVVLSEEDAERLESDTREVLEAMRARTKHLQGVTQALMAYDALLRRDLTLDEVDLADAFDEAAAHVARLASERNGHVDRPPRLPNVRGDRETLVTLMRELMENGLTFNDSDAPRVTARVLDDGATLKLAFDDNGVGIPLERREDAFHLFQRLQPLGKGSEGTGVGLAVARRIAHLHDGNLVAEESPEGGSRFVLTLPRSGPSEKPRLPAPRVTREF